MTSPACDAALDPLDGATSVNAPAEAAARPWLPAVLSIAARAVTRLTRAVLSDQDRADRTRPPHE